MEKAWVIKDADSHLYRLGVRRATEGMPFADEKNPARAYTLSLFFWGAGQSYSGQRMRGVLFQTCMVVFLIGTALCLLYGKHLLALLQEFDVSHAAAVLGVELLLLSALIFWAYNAIDAYHEAESARRVPFHGVRSRVLPMLSSLLLPGWGQFMNGQPLKGMLLACFGVLNIFSLITIPAVLLCWPALEQSRMRSLLEIVFAVTACYTPLTPLVCLFSGYDALKVSLDDTKKETLLDRMMLTVTRFRALGWMRIIIPRVGSTVALGLILGLIVFGVNRHYHPADFLYGRLAGAEEWLHQRGMTVVPDLIDRLLAKTLVAGK